MLLDHSLPRLWEAKNAIVARATLEAILESLYLPRCFRVELPLRSRVEMKPGGCDQNAINHILSCR
jgi:hypothetical protein